MADALIETCSWCERTFSPDTGSFRCPHCNTVIPNGEFELQSLRSLKKFGSNRLLAPELEVVIRLDAPPLRDAIVDRFIVSKTALSIPGRYIGHRAVLYILGAEQEQDETAVRGETE